MKNKEPQDTILEKDAGPTQALKSGAPAEAPASGFSSASAPAGSRHNDELEPEELEKFAEEEEEEEEEENDQTQHPIQSVAGEYARVSEIIALRLPDGDNAFSTSTNDAIGLAYVKPSQISLDGQTIVDPASFLEAVLIKSARTFKSDREKSDLSQVLYAFVTRYSPSAGERIQSIAEDKNLPPRPSPESILAAPSLTSMLAEAARLVVELSPGQQRVDLTHAILALLKSLQGQRAMLDILGVDDDPQVIFSELFDTVQKQLYLHVENTASQAEGYNPSEVIHAIFSQLKFLEEEAPESTSQSELYFTADRPARRFKDDLLGVSEDAQALGEVICLKEPGPPLAIGLFGDWGSGKSSFMNLLELSIDAITERAKQHAELPFIRDVVHIKFNAWTYTDTNLWASLTTEFFDQLRAGGYKRKPAQKYQNLVTEVSKRVSEAEGEAESLARKVVEARSEAHALSGEIRSIQGQLGSVSQIVLINRARQLVTQDADGGRQRLSEALQAIGVDLEDNKKNVENTARAIDMAAGLPGRILTFAKAMGGLLKLRLGWQSWLVWMLVVTGVMLFANFFLGDPLDLTHRLGPVWSWLGGFVPVIGSFWPVYKVVKPILDHGAQYADDVENQTRSLERKLNQKRHELAITEGEASKAEAKRAEIAAEAARFRGQGPAEVLDFFLHESAVTRSFEQDTGIVSRVHRAFEQLDAIFWKSSETGDAPVTREIGTKSKEISRFPSIDRIILYIDDLDRCRVQQVVQVLEAVHLLLAFRLFVVVVGVDPRWLENSLLEFYEKQLRGSRQETDGQTVASDRASVFDYLEKIFQIPVQLRGMTYGEDSSFGRLIAGVSGPVAAEETESDQSTRIPKDYTSRAAIAAGGITEIKPVTTVRLPPEPESAKETIKRVALRTRELEMMQQLGPIAGKSPRAAKRFVNLYRLVRGLRKGKALDRFLEEDRQSLQRPALYPAVLFWLAVHIGQSAKQIERLRAAVRLMSENNQTGIGLSLPLRQTDPISGEYEVIKVDPRTEKALADWPYLFGFWCDVPPDDRPDMLRAFAAVETSLPGSAGVKVLKEAMRETERFSFAYR